MGAEERQRTVKGALDVWFRRPPRLHGEVDNERTVSFLELFYDLVFVVLVSQTAHTFAEHPSWPGLADFAVVFTLVWIAWLNGSLHHEGHGRENGRGRGNIFGQMMILVVLAVFTALVTGGLPPSAPLALLWILPMALIGVGLGWLLGALGVFFRDIGELMPFVATALMYISPVFYPLDSVPDMLRPVLAVNPLSPIIEGIRASLIHGQAFDIAGFLRLCAESWVFACGSGALFLRVRPAFADVV